MVYHRITWHTLEVVFCRRTKCFTWEFLNFRIVFLFICMTFYMHDFHGKSVGLNEVSCVKISAYHGADKNDPESGHVHFLTTIHGTITCAK